MRKYYLSQLFKVIYTKLKATTPGDNKASFRRLVIELAGSVFSYLQAAVPVAHPRLLCLCATRTRHHPTCNNINNNFRERESDRPTEKVRYC